MRMNYLCEMRGHVLLRGEHLLAERAVDIFCANVPDFDVVVSDLLGAAPVNGSVVVKYALEL